jgi:hypothetical protein
VRHAQHQQRRRHLEEHREDVGHRDAALHQVDAVAEQQHGGEQRGPLAREDLPGEQVEDRRERDPGQRDHDPPAPGVVADGVHAERDQQLGRRRVHPLGGLRALQVLQRGLRVVDLVEHLGGRVAEAGQAERRRHHRQQQREEQVAGTRARGQPHGGGLYGAPQPRGRPPRESSSSA